MEQSPSALSLDQPSSVEDIDAIGVINALERTCELEAKLRQAIQQTHPLTTTLDWDFGTADKERVALLEIRYDARAFCHPRYLLASLVVFVWKFMHACIAMKDL